eukprot:COSAG01_NODE_6081_length_3863_cov_56.781615_1_plen_192_part_10
MLVMFALAAPSATLASSSCLVAVAMRPFGPSQLVGAGEGGPGGVGGVGDGGDGGVGGVGDGGVGGGGAEQLASQAVLLVKVPDADMTHPFPITIPHLNLGPGDGGAGGVGAGEGGPGGGVGPVGQAHAGLPHWGQGTLPGHIWCSLGLQSPRGCRAHRSRMGEMLGMALTLITARRTESKRIIVPLLWPHGR